MSNEDFLAPTNSKITCVTVQLVYMMCKNNMKSDVIEATESFMGIKYNVHTINIAVHRETCINKNRNNSLLSIYTD